MKRNNPRLPPSAATADRDTAKVVKIFILAILLHCGNQNSLRRLAPLGAPAKILASAGNLRFNLNKVAYMLVAAFKTDDRPPNL